MNIPIKVMIADDHQMVREGIVNYLNWTMILLLMGKQGWI